MEMTFLGETVHVSRVISMKSQRCARCLRETERCRKMYVKAGSCSTVCVELNEG